MPVRKAIHCCARSNLSEDKNKAKLCSERKTNSYAVSADVKKSNALFRAQDLAPCYGSYVASESVKKSNALFQAQDLAPCMAPMLRVKALKLIPAL